MMPNKFFHSLRFWRHCFLGSLLLGTLLVGQFLSAQNNRTGGNASGRFMERIDPAEGAQRIESFRQQRLDSDFRFEFVLEHLPKRARTIRYSGTMWGSWNDLGAISRFQIEPKKESAGAAVELIVQSGPQPRVWKRDSDTGRFRDLQGADLFQPILEGIVYRPFDLLMPFIYWTEYQYEGPVRVRSRVAQQFILYPPEGSVYEEAGIAAVRIGLDDDYDTLLFVEVLDANESVRSEFRVDAWKKVDGRYIVKTITLEDPTSGDRTRFVVEDAEVGLSLDAARFQPNAPVYGPELQTHSVDTVDAEE